MKVMGGDASARESASTVGDFAFGHAPAARMIPCPT
jgi:hypothetical protein